jgi:hypothetical protein
MPPIPKVQPYDRQPLETDKSWAAFCIYRDMGRERTTKRAQIECGYKHPSILEQWSAKHHWVSRCSAFDELELERESIALQKLRLSRRLQLEKDAWNRRDKLIKKADTIIRIPLVKPEIGEDGTTIFMPTDKWSLKDAIAFYQYADHLGVFAIGGEQKKMDEVEAVQLLADLGILPIAAIAAIGQGYEKFKEIIRGAFLNETQEP